MKQAAFASIFSLGFVNSRALSFGLALVLGLTLQTPTAHAVKPVPPSSKAALQFKKVSDGAAFVDSTGEKVTVFGKAYAAADFCTIDAASNPDMIEVYELKNSKFETALLCPGMLDGDTNIVAVFSKTAKPIARKVKPEASTGRISDSVFERTLRDLTK